MFITVITKSHHVSIWSQINRMPTLSDWPFKFIVTRLGPPRIHVCWPKFLSNPLRMLHASRIIACYVWQRTGSSYCCPECLPLRTPDSISKPKTWTAQFNLCLACGGGYISYCDGRPWTVKCFLWLHISVWTISQPSLQPAWSECIIPHTENDTERTVWPTGTWHLLNG